MKTLVVYTSQTGFTKRYAEWLADRMHADILTVKEAEKKSDSFFNDYDAVVYGGWAMAGTVVHSKWFLQKAPAWRGKKLVLFCVGGSPVENPEVETAMHNLLDDSQREYIKVFYCQGGLSYENMKTPSRLMMKAFASMVRKKKDATESEKMMGEMLSKSYDISDIKYIEPIEKYLLGNE